MLASRPTPLTLVILTIAFFSFAFFLFSPSSLPNGLSLNTTKAQSYSTSDPQASPDPPRSGFSHEKLDKSQSNAKANKNPSSAVKDDSKSAPTKTQNAEPTNSAKDSSSSEESQPAEDKSAKAAKTKPDEDSKETEETSKKEDEGQTSTKGSIKDGETSKSASKSADSSKTSSGHSSYAYVAFLQDHWTHEEQDNDEDDEYFVATRVLGYQLMHAEKTRSNTSIPFVVACTPRVKDSKKRRLAKDGAIVVDVEYVPNPEWINKTEGLSGRWSTMMTKLRVFELTDYDKILFIDSDVTILDRLDGIFHDGNAGTQKTDTSLVDEEDEGKIPKEYVYAAQAQQHTWEHAYPPDPNEPLFGAGFFLVKPASDLFDYYMHLLYSDPPRFDAVFFEQALMNHAHRRDGPMPWKDLDHLWTTSFPTMTDVEAGARSMHHKFWWDDTNIPDHGLNKLTAMWWRIRGEMGGYYIGRDEALGDEDEVDVDDMAESESEDTQSESEDSSSESKDSSSESKDTSSTSKDKSSESSGKETESKTQKTESKSEDKKKDS